MPPFLLCAVLLSKKSSLNMTFCFIGCHYLLTDWPKLLYVLNASIKILDNKSLDDVFNSHPIPYKKQTLQYIKVHTPRDKQKLATEK